LRLVGWLRWGWRRAGWLGAGLALDGEVIDVAWGLFQQSLVFADLFAVASVGLVGLGLGPVLGSCSTVK
jgi:hypothetical protein